MQFEWDENKNRQNIRKHRIDFADVPSVFKNDMLIDYDDRFDYGEDRWIALGLMRGIVVVVVFAEPRRDTIRIISARKANRHEEGWLVQKYSTNHLLSTRTSRFDRLAS